MLRRFLSIVFAVLALAAVLPAYAQSCTNGPWYYEARYTCGGGSAYPCPIGQPITFRVQPYFPDAALSCATVVWIIDDVEAPSRPATDNYVTTLAPGMHEVAMRITVPGYSPYTPYPIAVAVARGIVNINTSYLHVVEGAPAVFHAIRTNVDVETVVNWTATPLSSDDGGISPLSGSFTMPAGQAAGQFTIATTDDAVFTGTRYYNVSLTTASNDYLVGSYGETLYVEDNDYAILDFAQSELKTAENAGTYAIEVKRTGVLTNRVEVGYSIYSYSWYGNTVVPVSGTLVFEPNQTSASFNVVPVDNAIYTGTRSVQVELRYPSNGAKFPQSDYWNSRTLLVEDDEPMPTLTVDDISIAEGDSGMSQATFRLRLSNPAPGVEVSYYPVSQTAQYGSDYQSFGGWVSFGEETERTIVIQIIGDTVREPHETLHLEITPGYGPAILMPTRDPVLTILNDETDLTPTSAQIARGAQGSFVLDIGLPAQGTMNIPLVSSNTGVASVPPSVVFNDGQSVGTFDVTGVSLGSAEISVQLPASHGNKTFIANVTVHNTGTAVFTPKHVVAYVGEETSVGVALDPPSSSGQGLRMRSGNTKIATVSELVDIPAGGSGLFTVKGVATGGTIVTTTLPAEYGGLQVHLFVDVVEKPLTATLTSLSPATGTTAGGTAFEARGTLLTAQCTLSFGGVPATNLAVAGGNSITGTTPPHAAGVVDVTLRCGGASFTLANAFTYVSFAPTLASISPAFGSMTGGTHVRATVTNVDSSCWMFFGGVAATQVRTASAQELFAVTPPRAQGGSVDVSVRCGNESATLTNAFNYSSSMEPSASIISVDPLTGSPGQSITIHGSRLRPTDRIRFDDAGATVISTSPDAHVVRIPELPAGMSSITMTDAEGRVTTTGPIFRITEAAPPFVGSVAPSSAMAGGVVTLDGRGFRPGFTFHLGTYAMKIVSLTYTRAIARLPLDAPAGTYPIEVRDASGRLVATGANVTVLANGVALRSIAPPCGSTAGNDVVTIRGVGFLDGAMVRFNGVAARRIELVSAAELRVTTPPGVAGTARVEVTNATGAGDTISDAFRYRSPLEPGGCSGRSRGVRH